MSEPSTLIADRFQIDTKTSIGRGSFGWIYRATDLLNSNKVAIKFERKKTKNCHLEYENRILKELQGPDGFPKVYFFGALPKYYVLVMDLLGNNLETQFNNMQRYALSSSIIEHFYLHDLGKFPFKVFLL